MEFKSRKVKRAPNRSSFRKREVQQNAPLVKPRLLSVLVRCEVFEIPELNRINLQAAKPSNDAVYHQKTRMREYTYHIENVKEEREIIQHWKIEVTKFANLTSIQLGSKIKFEIRPLQQRFKDTLDLTDQLETYDDKDCPSCQKNRGKS
tara:strand:- start:388 stop:834 length:447 start_codon:yes stop_codon:yes gene_type:complete